MPWPSAAGEPTHRNSNPGLLKLLKPRGRLLLREPAGQCNPRWHLEQGASPSRKRANEPTPCYMTGHHVETMLICTTEIMLLTYSSDQLFDGNS